ncbi:unnamed protein product [Strongylus vulgaris]|uniref:Myosin motor domain-containing protein n=1 Tax=Strongylus vulgaris TaxID=40348 RepID=A0A3P7IW04_STRVU|nr:unnamed protein product [Strongylus vulgaris]
MEEIPEIRRGSDSALSQFLRGDLQIDMPDFVDTSVFKTIFNQARRTPAKGEERMTTVRCLQILKETVGKRKISKKPTTVSRQFEYSLSRLMNTLAHSSPYFIRCIKSNNDKIPNHFDDNIILRQLRYTGMLETVRIRRAGYSVRIEWDAFIQQYRILLKKGLASTKDDVKDFLNNHPSIAVENIQYGVSKIYMRDAEKLILDDHLHKVIMQHIGLGEGGLGKKPTEKTGLCCARYSIQLEEISRRETLQAIKRCCHRSTIRIQRLGEIPRSRDLAKIRVKRIQAVKLPVFDLNDPQSLAAFAGSDDDFSRHAQYLCIFI